MWELQNMYDNLLKRHSVIWALYIKDGRTTWKHNVLLVIYTGLVLGPLLFILYSNDIPRLLSYCKSILFADDTTIYLNGKKLNILHEQVNSDLKSLTDLYNTV